MGRQLDLWPSPSSESNCDPVILVLCNGETVERIRVNLIFLVVAFRVIHADRPESVHGHVSHRQDVARFSVALWRYDVEIDRVARGICTPG